MRIFDFVCSCSQEDIRVVRAGSLKDVDTAEKTCSHCGELMQRYFGRASPEVALLGANWPKRDIKETARRKRRSEVLAERQEKVWKPRQPRLNLDPDVQKEYRQRIARGGPLSDE